MILQVKNMKKLTKTIYLPPGSSERFVSLRDFGSSVYFGKDVFMAALCSYPAGYRLAYPAPRRHLVWLCRSGSFSYTCGEKSGVVSKGDILLMPSGVDEELCSLEQSESIFFLLEPSPAWSFEHGFCAPSEWVELVWQLMEKALQLNGSPQDDQVQKQAAGTLLFDVLQKFLHAGNTDMALFRQLRSKLQMSPHIQWSVQDMADICRVSVPHFFVLCRRYFGVSPYAMLKKIRLDQAKELLTSTGYPVKSIASLCGYEHPFAFSRSFKQEFGVSPMQYRAKQK
ncbi:MAG: helix-turn-helix transcriptional regulator [Lentisphaerae bacterium]|nr:helix-turn-helix transcriptional regulator [Lentisphaerota bacterium]